jgi:YgiT-type zinc finger domain-containing protein
MGTRDQERQWRELAEDVLTGMQEWRLQHPRATWREIETALDERLSRVRARMLQDLALASRATDLGGSEAGERPRCPACGGSLEARGQHTRLLTTAHDRTIRLTRSYAACPTCGEGLFPPG